MVNNETYQMVNIGSIEEYLNFTMLLRDLAHWSFRGQRNEKWPLGIHLNQMVNINENEMNPILDKKTYLRKILNQFKRRCVEHVGLFVPAPPPETDEWRWLFYAQHYGLQTRLLDWTSNPLVALYFAVENILSGDNNSFGSVWALTVDYDYLIMWNQWDKKANIDFRTPENVISSVEDTENDFKWFMINPPFDMPRVSRQSARFSFHADKCLEPIECQIRRNKKEKLFKIILKENDGSNPAKKILKQLCVMNINHASLFPDPSGLSKFINSEWSEIGLIESLRRPPYFHTEDVYFGEKIEDKCGF